MEIVVEDETKPESGKHRILTSRGYPGAFRTINEAALGEREILFTISGPDSEEAADRIHELMDLGYAPLFETIDGHAALMERELARQED